MLVIRQKKTLQLRRQLILAGLARFLGASRVLCVAGEPEAYAPGEFFKRELPLLLLVLNSISTAISVVVIDGYVWLGADEKPGLGVHLFKLFGVPVIGVAKTKFRDDTWSEKVFRPGSIRPLFVTSIGMATTAATNCIMQIHGNHRIPTILRDVDQTARAALGAPK